MGVHQPQVPDEEEELQKLWRGHSKSLQGKVIAVLLTFKHKKMFAGCKLAQAEF